MSGETEAPDWAKAEVAKAIEILKSDGVHIHKTYAQFQASLADKGTKKEGEETTEEGGAPPEKPEEDKNTPPKKRGYWWGDRADEE
jgi:hypothetical protein